MITNGFMQVIGCFTEWELNKLSDHNILNSKELICDINL